MASHFRGRESSAQSDLMTRAWAIFRETYDSPRFPFRSIGLYEAANATDAALNETIAAIHAAPAATLFGVAVKLAALPSELEDYDVVDSFKATLPDIVRMLAEQGETFDPQIDWGEEVGDEEEGDDDA